MDSLYDGFDINDTSHLPKHSTSMQSDDPETRSILSSSMNMMTESVRPMTSNKSAGYSSSNRSNTKSSYSGSKSKSNRQFQWKQNSSSSRGGSSGQTESDRAEFLERDVFKLLRESIVRASSGELESALDLAQKCRKMEVEAMAYRVEHGVEDGIKGKVHSIYRFHLVSNH